MTKSRKKLTEAQRVLAREAAERYNAKPGQKEKRKAYYARPEVQARYKARGQTEAHKAYQRAYRASGRGKISSTSSGRKKNGFTRELEVFLNAVQCGLCAVCSRPLTRGKGNQGAHADHCHDTGQPRGLLCADCNIAEGRVKSTGLDPVEFGRRLAHYLVHPPARAFTP